MVLIHGNCSMCELVGYKISAILVATARTACTMVFHPDPPVSLSDSSANLDLSLGSFFFVALPHPIASHRSFMFCNGFTVGSVSLSSSSTDLDISILALFAASLPKWSLSITLLFKDCCSRLRYPVVRASATAGYAITHASTSLTPASTQ